MRFVLLCSAFSLLPGCLWAGSPQQSSAHVLKVLSDQEQAYRRSVPSFTCSEAVTSTAKHKGKLLRRVEYQGDLRVKRDGDKPLDEKFTLTSYMGRPVEDKAEKPLLLYMSGGLAGGAMSFFQEKVQTCFDTQVSGSRIDFRGNSVTANQCDETSNTVGFATLDADSKLVSGEVQRPGAEANQHKRPTYSKIEYADVRLDGRVYRLPSHVYAELTKNGLLLTFDAYYTSCKLFAATTTIRPGDGVDQPEP